MSGVPHVHVITIWVLESLFGLANGCQASCDHVIATYNVPCWTPQKANGETGRIGCKLLLGAGWKRFLLFEPAWTLAAKIQCMEPKIPLSTPAGNSAEAGEKDNHLHACLDLSNWNSSMPRAQNLSLLPPAESSAETGKELPALCLHELQQPNASKHGAPNPSTGTERDSVRLTICEII